MLHKKFCTLYNYDALHIYLWPVVNEGRGGGGVFATCYLLITVDCSDPASCDGSAYEVNILIGDLSRYKQALLESLQYFDDH